ncbi:transcriptional regulator [Pleionea sediminis]|uniref:transcriptional regulator n=1 Tax=Pleionea sediminis TaxID=2569479 RepID=UPI001185F682|nr:winged helix-turn-helix domain-containing protein [Pleionea sediminis]
MNDNLANPNLVIFIPEDNLIQRDGQQYKLDPIINALLQFLLSNPKQNISRNDIATHVWPNAYVSDDAINRAISVLRKALSDSREEYIKTVHRIGYQFVNSEKIRVQKKDELNSLEADCSSIPGKMKRPWYYMERLNFPLTFALIFVISLSVIVSAIDRDNASGVTPIVLIKPFTNQVTQLFPDYFEDDLHENILLNLSKIPQVNVIDGLERNAGKDSNFILSGVVKDYSNIIRVSIKLVDKSSEALLFSYVINLENNTASKLIDEISQQIASALRLKFVHQHEVNYYLNLSTRLSPHDIEQLIIANTYLREGNEFAIQKAISILTSLNSQFPDTPEIEGALIKASISNGSINVEHRKEVMKYVDMAKDVLLSEPNNIDALIALLYGYSSQAKYRQHAFDIANILVSKYPGEQSVWRAFLYLMIKSAVPCETIENRIINGGAQSAFSSHQLSTIQSIIDTCASNKSLEKLSQQWERAASTIRSQDEGLANRLETSFANNSLMFSLRSDYLAFASEHQFHLYSNTFSQLQWLKVQFMLENFDEVRLFIEQAKDNDWSRWMPVIQLFGDLHGLESNFSRLSNEEIALYDVDAFLLPRIALLIKRSDIEGVEKLKPAFQLFLDNQPNISISTENSNASLAMIAAQYFSGDIEGAEISAKHFYNKLEKYRELYPESYSFWGLARFQIVSGFYCSNSCAGFAENREHMLAENFRDDEAWWTHDRTTVEAFLLPWRDNDFVLRYLQEIENNLKSKRGQLTL